VVEDQVVYHLLMVQVQEVVVVELEVIELLVMDLHLYKGQH
jgi:hypothetical protein